MKLLAASLILALSSPLASAFGPGPFSNGSPLATGTDGVYQAVATGTNLTGVFSWAILNGVQLADQANNGWTFFVDGNVVSGNTVANVAENSVSGILDPGANFQIPVDAQKKPILPYIKVLSNTVAQGQFRGNINLKSPVAAFSGSGSIEGTPARTYQVLFMSEATSSNPPVYFVTDTVISTTTNMTSNSTTTNATQTNSLPEFQTPSSVFNPATGQGIMATTFNFRGTRLSTAYAAGQPPAPAASTPAPQ